MLATFTFLLAFLASQAPQKELVLTCVVNPVVVTPGGDVAIRATGFSALNRQMSFSFKASAGRVTPTGATTATLHTAADSPATITVTCNVVDDRGKEASQAVTVTVQRP